MRRRRGLIVGGLVVGVVVAATVVGLKVTYYWEPAITLLRGRKTVAERVVEYGAVVRPRWEERLPAVGMSYPPGEIRLVAFKAERRLEVYCRAGDGWLRAATYPVLAASGVTGPKLREGDRQVPEGRYAIESLNPNSRFHLALRVGYPNRADRERAAVDGRTKLGGDIMIHGKDVSTGCIAVGDEAIEELFVLVAEAGREKCELIIVPWDFRARAERPSVGVSWAGELYQELERALFELRR